MLARWWRALGRWIRRSAKACRWRLKVILGQPFHIHIENRWRLGDEVMALPFYRLVQSRYPRARITASVNHPALLVGSGVQPLSNVTEWGCDRYMFVKSDGRARPRLQHLCRRHRIPYQALEPVLSPPQDGAVATAPPRLRRVAYSSGAGWDCKRWPTASMRLLCEAMAREWPNTEFVELGKDCDHVGIGLDKRNQMEISDVAALLRTCCLYIGPDSGLVHLALAVNTPVVALFGPVRPAEAIGVRARLQAVLAPTACAGCWTDGRMTHPGACPLGIRSAEPADYPCMKSITPEHVLTVIRDSGFLPNA